MRKSVFGVSDQARHEPGCTAPEDSKMLEISGLESTFYVAKTKAPILSAVKSSIVLQYDHCI